MRSKLEDLVDGVQELRLVWEHRDVSLHSAFRLVEGVGVNDDQLLKLGLLLLLKSKPQVKLLLEGPGVSFIKLEYKVLNYCHPKKSATDFTYFDYFGLNGWGYFCLHSIFFFKQW